MRKPSLKRRRAYREWVLLKARELEEEGYQLPKGSSYMKTAKRKAKERFPEGVQNVNTIVSALAALVGGALGLYGYIYFFMHAVFNVPEHGELSIWLPACGITMFLAAIDNYNLAGSFWFMTDEEYEAQKRREHDRAVPGKHRKEQE